VVELEVLVVAVRVAQVLEVLEQQILVVAVLVVALMVVLAVQA
jgi:hypothetical protein